MTDEERKEVERQTRFECARIAALESQYWAGVEDDQQADMGDISIGAMGASANIAAAIFMGKTYEQVAQDIENRDQVRWNEIEAAATEKVQQPG